MDKKGHIVVEIIKSHNGDIKDIDIVGYKFPSSGDSYFEASYSNNFLSNIAGCSTIELYDKTKRDFYYYKDEEKESILSRIKKEFSDCEIEEVNKVCGEFDKEEDVKKYLDFILLNSTKASKLRGLC